MTHYVKYRIHTTCQGCNQLHQVMCRHTAIIRLHHQKVTLNLMSRLMSSLGSDIILVVNKVEKLTIQFLCELTK